MIKNMLFAVVLFLVMGTPGAKAQGLGDQIQASFVGNAKTAIEFTTKGQTQYEFLSNFIEIGNLNGSPVAAIDFAVLGTQLPDNTVRSVEWANGVKLHLSPILKSYIKLESGWEFINNLEIDGRWSYNYTQRHGTLGISIGYPFK